MPSQSRIVPYCHHSSPVTSLPFSRSSCQCLLLLASPPACQASMFAVPSHSPCCSSCVMSQAIARAPSQSFVRRHAIRRAMPVCVSVAVIACFLPPPLPPFPTPFIPPILPFPPVSRLPFFPASSATCNAPPLMPALTLTFR